MKSVATFLMIFVFSASQAKAELKISEEEFECLARNIYFEGAFEPFIGKVAIAMTTITRMKRDEWPDTICGVVYQKKISDSGNLVCQFSWVCLNKNHVPKKQKLLDSCRKAAAFVVRHYQNLQGVYAGVTHYYADYIDRPSWAFQIDFAGKFGTHYFFKQR